MHTLVNVFHKCKRNRNRELIYELKIDKFEIVLCKWCEWKMEIVVQGEKEAK